MADTFTTNLNLTKPEPGAAEDTWGISLNSDLDTLDAIFSSSGTQVNLNPNQVNFADNKKAVFGTGNDLQIYHDGSDSYISDNGTGDLRLQGNGLKLINSSNLETYANFVSNGASTLYYDNSAKLATTSTGIDVTGTVTSDGLIVGDGHTIGDDSFDNLLIASSTAENIILNANDAGVTVKGDTQFLVETEFGTDRFKVDTSTGDISFYNSTGTSQALFWDASAESLAITGANNTWTLSNTTLYGNRAAQIYIGASDAAGQLAFVSGGSERMRINSSGNVGIGTTSPAAKLDVAGEALIQGRLQVTSSAPEVLFSVPAGGLDSRIHNDGSGNFIFGTGTNSTTPTERMRIDSSGNVGIGTTDPTVASGNGLAIYDSIVPRVQLRNSTSGDASTDGAGIFMSGSDLGIENRESSNIIFYNNTEKMRIDSSGRVGIGTTSPSEKLDVYGSIKIGTTANSNILNRSNSHWIQYNGGATLNDTYVRVASTDAASIGRTISMHTNATERMRIDSSGNVGIGTSSPDYKLTIGDATDSAGTDLLSLEGGGYLTRFRNNSDVTLMFTNTTKGIAFGTQGTSGEKMRIDSSGNVGIGTTSPSAVLEVEGSPIATGDTRYELLISEDNTASAGRGGGLAFARQGVIYGGIKTLQDTASDSNASMYFQTVTGGSNTTKMTIDSSGNVGIGTASPASLISGGSSPILSIGGTDGGLTTGEKAGTISFITSDTSYTGTYSDGITGEIASVATSSTGAAYGLAFYTGTITGSDRGERLRIRHDGNVGIGTSSPACHLEVSGSGNGSVSDHLRITSTDTQAKLAFVTTTGNGAIYQNEDDLVFATNTANTERMRIDSSGNLLVGTTSAIVANSASNVGTAIGAGLVESARAGVVAQFNRHTSDGTIVDLQKNGTTVGSIGTRFSDMYLGTGDTNLRFNDADDRVNPADATGNARDAAVDLGASTARFKDLHLSGQANVGSVLATGNVTAYSDERLKDNIQTLQGSKVLEMRGVSFTKDGKASSGVIAQEIEKVAPELVHTAKDEMGTKSVAYGNLVGYLIEAIKDQQQQIDELKARLDNDSSK